MPLEEEEWKEEDRVRNEHPTITLKPHDHDHSDNSWVWSASDIAFAKYES
jgi:hypothetical protein